MLVRCIICIIISLLFQVTLHAQYKNTFRETLRKYYTIVAKHTNVKTNALYDLALIVPHYGWAPTPNFAIEYLPARGHWTGVFDYYIANWRNDDKNKTWTVRNYSLESRYYLHKNIDLWHRRTQENIAPFTGHYFCSGINFFRYDIQLNEREGYISRYLPKNFGVNIGYGYVYRIKQTRFKIEGCMLLGFVHSRYDTYHASESWATPGDYYYDWHNDPKQYKRYNRKVNYWGPTRIGISVSYDLH